MSIPAVLYDHVPVDHLEEYGYVSTVIHRTSAPCEDSEDLCGSDMDTNPFSSSLLMENRKGDDESREKKEINLYGGDVDTETIEDLDHDDRRMETIIEDIDFDYVLIPIPAPIIVPGEEDSDGTDLPTTSRRAKWKLRNKTRTCSKSFYGDITSSLKTYGPSITKYWKDDGTYLARCVSKCVSGCRALLRPLQFYTRDWLTSFAIYSSYDWVSETIIDSSGNRLILPGSCVSLDAQSTARRDDLDETHKEGTLIVPEGSEGTSGNVPTSSCCSIWASKTIMVSAHDLLAVKHDQRLQQEGDGDDPKPLSVFEATEEGEKGKPPLHRCYYRDDECNNFSSMIVANSTQSITEQWIDALWKLAERKAYFWYFICRSYLRKSLQEAKSKFIESQKHIIRYYQSKNRQATQSLAIVSNYSFGNKNDPDETRGAEWNTCSSIVLGTSTQPLMDRSILDQKTSDEIINGCDFVTRNSECMGVIEMSTPPKSKRRKGYSAF